MGSLTVTETLAWLAACFTTLSFVPQVVLGRALQSHPDTAVTFRYHAGSSNAVFRSGNAPSGAQSATVSCGHRASAARIT